MTTLSKAITLTAAAAARVKAVLAQSEAPVLGLRVAIQPKGCSGLSYVIEYAREQGPGDEVVEDKGVTIFIDPKAMMFLVGSEMDYVEGKLESGFQFKNPNEKSRCGCGESFNV